MTPLVVAFVLASIGQPSGTTAAEATRPSPAAATDTQTPEVAQTPATPDDSAPPNTATTDPPVAETPNGFDAQMRATFERLSKAGLLDDREATLEEFTDALAAGEARYVRGDALGSAIALFELVTHPRYAGFTATAQMSSAYYHLGVSLSAYGAESTATAAFAQVLARGPDDPYFTPALRRHVDLGLASKDYVAALADLDRHLVAEGRAIPLTDEDLDEREYLAARAAGQRGDAVAALASYDAVGPRSRFRTAARYMQGLTYAQRREFRRAESAFCEVLGGKDQEITAYYVDRRYFPVRDLAQLGLGRIAHEELRHDHAFYHYFSVPQDSSELAHALFESAWTMAEAGEYAVARDLVRELRERYPNSAQATEARLLAAMLQLYDCEFRGAELEFTKVIDDLAPIGDHIAEIRKDEDRLLALHRELTSVRAGERIDGELARHRLLLAMMDEDPSYARITRQADTLRREAGFAAAIDGELARLQARLARTDTTVRRNPEGDALVAVHAADDLARGVAGLEAQIRRAEQAGADATAIAELEAEAAALRGRVRGLRRDATALLATHGPRGQAPTGDLRASLGAERTNLVTLRTRSLTLADDLDRRAARVASDRLGALAQRVDDLLGEARMGRIDAVLGAKKKLEIEVRDMAAGRFPPELFGKLQIEGVVGDDEEFWPYEGEYWADEYEGYR